MNEFTALTDHVFIVCACMHVCVQLLSDAMADLQQNPVPIIHFGLLTIDTSMFFPGGHARVYKGWYKEEQVAIKILFCIELTSSVMCARGSG